MDKIAQYQLFLKEILEEYASHRPSNEQVVNQILADDAQGHYYLMRVGWKRGLRVHGCVFHADIIGEKIWIQDDWTEYGIANELTDRGVPRTEIVLAFYLETERANTDFAVN